MYSRLILAAICLVGLSACSSGTGDTTRFAPEPDVSPLKNPGKGWVIYLDQTPLDQYSDKAVAVASVALNRYHWSEIEPEEGVFNWWVIDRDLAACARRGLKFNFRVQSANSGSKLKYPTPKWVFDAGAKYMATSSIPKEKWDWHNSDQIIPMFDDPIYLEKLRAFTMALAKRYDGNPHIEYIDIGSYGNWGEQHLFPWWGIMGMKDISPEAHRKHLQIALDAFKRTRVCFPWGVSEYNENYDWAVDQGAAIRRDGICGNSDGSETLRCFGKTPAVLEGYGGYQEMKKLGWWDAQDTGRGGMGHAFEGCAERGKASYLPLGNQAKDSDALLAAEPALVDRMTNRMGYHFVLKEAVFPSSLKAGTPAKVALNWENTGLAYVYVPCVVGFALLDGNGRVVDDCWPGGTLPAKWAPDRVTSENPEIVFTKPPAGEYRLALGLFSNIGDTRPAFRLGIKAQSVNGWYVLGNTSVRR